MRALDAVDLGALDRRFVNRTLHVDLARFMNGNVNFLVLRVTLPLALISNYNFYIMHVSLCFCAGVAVAAGV